MLEPHRGEPSGVGESPGAVKGEGRFTVGDLIMTTVLRNLRHTDLVAENAKLAAYVARCEARPAFARALAAQMDDFEERQAA